MGAIERKREAADQGRRQQETADAEGIRVATVRGFEPPPGAPGFLEGTPPMLKEPPRSLRAGAKFHDVSCFGLRPIGGPEDPARVDLLVCWPCGADFLGRWETLADPKGGRIVRPAVDGGLIESDRLYRCRCGVGELRFRILPEAPPELVAEQTERRLRMARLGAKMIADAGGRRALRDSILAELEARHRGPSRLDEELTRSEAAIGWLRDHSPDQLAKMERAVEEARAGSRPEEDVIRRLQKLRAILRGESV